MFFDQANIEFVGSGWERWLCGPDGRRRKLLGSETPIGLGRPSGGSGTFNNLPPDRCLTICLRGVAMATTMYPGARRGGGGGYMVAAFDSDVGDNRR